MRTSERDRWFRVLEEQQEAFARERELWAVERARLVNALLSKTPGEYAVRQRASEPTPISAAPREERDALHPMGL